jgi:hypothetical protein
MPVTQIGNGRGNGYDVLGYSERDVTYAHDSGINNVQKSQIDRKYISDKPASNGDIAPQFTISGDSDD